MESTPWLSIAPLTHAISHPSHPRRHLPRLRHTRHVDDRKRRPSQGGPNVLFLYFSLSLLAPRLGRLFSTPLCLTSALSPSSRLPLTLAVPLDRGARPGSVRNHRRPSRTLLHRRSGRVGIYKATGRQHPHRLRGDPRVLLLPLLGTDTLGPVRDLPGPGLGLKIFGIGPITTFALTHGQTGGDFPSASATEVHCSGKRYQLVLEFHAVSDQFDSTCVIRRPTCTL